MARSDRRRGGGGIAAVLVIALVAVAGAMWGPEFLNRYGDRLFSQSSCTVTLGEESHTLTAEQANNTALIAAVSRQRGLPARAATIAIATAIQESGLRNIDYGDRDSVGLFQQRPSQGWGSVEEIMDPYYSAGEFYAGLVLVNGWRTLSITVAAQEVQRSAFPEAYGNHEPQSRLWASALRGHSGPQAVTCDLGDATPGTVDAFAARVDADFGAGVYRIEEVSVDDGVATLAVTPADGSDTDRNAMAAWAVTAASEESVVAVSIDGAGWSRSTDSYVRDGETSVAGVAVEIAVAD